MLDQGFLHANVPLQDLLPYLLNKFVHKIAWLHHIALGSHVPKSEFSHYFEGHDCASCSLYSSVFSCVDPKSVRERN